MRSLMYGLAFASSMSVNAELVSVGMGEGVYDSTSGITWSSFEKTKGYSLSEINQALSQNGALYGWELANYNDVFTLWSNNVPRYNENAHLEEFGITKAERAVWSGFFGITYSDNRSISYYFNPELNQWKIGGYYRDGMLDFLGENVKFNHTEYVENGSYGYAYGYYLVLSDQFSLSSSGNVVSADVPSSGLFFGPPLLLGLVGFRKRTKKV